MKKVTCSVIEEVPVEWSSWRKIIDREKYKKFDHTFPDTLHFCKNVLEDSSEEIQLIERIGSPSADAEVYKIRFNGMEFALKLMPRVDNDSEKRNREEIETAFSASRYPDYFPLTFAYGYCPSSSYYLNKGISSFIPRAIEYKTVQDQLSIMSDKIKKKRFESDYRNGINLKEKYGLKSPVNAIQVDFLVSELANGDLGNYIKKNRDVKEWRKILIDVITGIYYLTVVIGKVHPDLHFGNILISKTKDGIKSLIHDFGRCYPVDENIPATYKASLTSFCTEFISCSKTRDDLFIPREISIIIEDIFKVIKDLHIDLINIKDVYEEIIYPIILSKNE